MKRYELTVKKICRSCNKEYALKHIEHNANYRQSVSNFENCPHCGKRNDVWIAIDWPEETTFSTMQED